MKKLLFLFKMPITVESGYKGTVTSRRFICATVLSNNGVSV